MHVRNRRYRKSLLLKLKPLKPINNLCSDISNEVNCSFHHPTMFQSSNMDPPLVT